MQVAGHHFLSFRFGTSGVIPGESVFLNLTLCDLIHMALELHSDEGYRSSSTYDGVLSQTYSTSKMH